MHVIIYYYIFLSRLSPNRVFAIVLVDRDNLFHRRDQICILEVKVEGNFCTARHINIDSSATMERPAFSFSCLYAVHAIRYQ